jgi:hypothetical protein
MIRNKKKTTHKKKRTHKKKGGTKTKSNSNKFVNLQCSPTVTVTQDTSSSYTCLSDDAIQKLKSLWNIRHPDVPIRSNDKKEIWEFIRENMKNVCNKESCWLKQNFVDGKLNHELKTAFAPKWPEEWKKNPNEWLSSLDIMNVMKQYESAYRCFDFIGPSPIDFDTLEYDGDCVWEELCHFSLEKEIKAKKFKFGIIFNLDPHYKPGSHWVSLFINAKKGKIFYFDSAGDEIPKQIMKFVDKVMEQGSQLETPIHFTFDQNYPVEHQYGNTECGVYSLFFIVHMLEDKITDHYLKTHKIKDKYMEKFRKIYFNPEL